VTLDEFKRSLSGSAPPSAQRDVIRALWHAGRDEWTQAHEIAQSVDDADGSWVHAHLHRQEGDLANASYWYSRAGKSGKHLSLEEEWEEIVTELLR